jgi:hypothetical protein
MKPRTFLALVVLSLTITVSAQAPNPLYLREMPAEAKVVNEIQGTDPIDTVARQAGTFDQLNRIIQDLASAQGRSSSNLLPDEKKISDYYQILAARAWQRVYAATDTDRKRRFQLTGYSMDPNFKVQLLEKFFTPNFRNVYAKAEQFLDDRHKRFTTGQEQPMAPPANPGGNGATDPGTMAMRRCVTAGRDPLQCFGEVFKGGMIAMAGGDAGMGSAFGQTLPAGLRMTGLYGDGRFGLSFTEDTLWVTCDHVTTQANYSVAINNNQVVVGVTPGLEGAKLGNKPFSLNFNPEGNIAGTGTVQISAMVPAPGSHPQAQQTRRRYISEEEAKHAPYWENPQRDVGGNPYVEEPINSGGGPMVSKTSTCQLGTNRPLGSVGPTYAMNTLNPLLNLLGAGFISGAPWKQRSAKDKAWPGPGLRLHGEYDGQGGLSLEFHEDTVVLGCGETFLASHYAIRGANGQWGISIDNRGNPITLALGPGRSISGSGPIRVNGNAFVGDRDNGSGSMFAASMTTCQSGTLNPTR